MILLLKYDKMVLKIFKKIFCLKFLSYVINYNKWLNNFLWFLLIIPLFHLLIY